MNEGGCAVERRTGNTHIVPLSSRGCWGTIYIDIRSNERKQEHGRGHHPSYKGFVNVELINQCIYSIFDDVLPFTTLMESLTVELAGVLVSSTSGK